MKKISLVAFFSFVFLGLNAQSINITDPDFSQSSPLNCANFDDGSVTNFFDDGGGANYTSNRRDTITICPDLPNGPKITAAFGINAGYSFDIHPTDTIYVFDGPSVSSPFMGAYNSGSHPNGFTHTATFENNPSGCLTIVFHSDGASEGTGWAANITCGNPAQPFDPHIEAFINGQGPNALNPIDTGYVDVCFGDSILLVAKPVFPYSVENNGFGYSQTLTNVNYNWQFSNGTVGANNDSIWFTPPTRNGFFVTLRITDLFPQLEQTFCKIRVSQIPSFAGTGPLDGTLCINEQTILVGGTNATDTVGVEFPPGSFEIGGTVAGLTYLPDGSGQTYSTAINMSGFEDGATFSSASDLQSICLTMEHSYLGDLEMWLTCPNGQEVTIFNSYSPGYIPGGFGGGGTYLGGADDTGNGTPGIGAEYCFSSTNNTWGSFPTEHAGGNFINAGTPAGNSMNPNGVYLPEESFDAFIGCPLNGAWTVTVRDNLSIDDGYIFEWGLYFDASLFPNNENYTNTITSDFWTNDPSIVSGQGDTLIVVAPPGPGTHSYTFNVVDNFGCPYDTTVTIFVKDPIVLNMPAEICELTLTTTLNTGTNDGVWSFYGSAGTPTFAANNVNTTITFPTYGLYNLVYSDTSCTDKDTATVFVRQPPWFDFGSDFFVCPGGTELLQFQDSLEVSTYSWGQPQFTGFTANLPAGTFTASYTTLLGCTRDTTFTIETRPANVLATYPLVCGTTLDMTNNTGVDGGTWTAIGGGISPVTFASNAINTEVEVTTFGTYLFVYTDECESDTTVVEFNTGPSISIVGASTCLGEQVVISAGTALPNTTYTWNSGQTGPSITVTEAGAYILAATNSCGTSIDTAVVILEPCAIDVPNVFTPNGDGSNDFFQLIVGDGLSNFSCVILNRWGNVIREFNGSDFQWDGTDENGNMVTEGVYFYKISTVTIAGKEIIKHGNVTMILPKP